MPSAYPTEFTPSGWTVVFVTGPLTFSHVHVLRGQLCSLVDAGRHQLAVNLAGIKAIDSSGIGALIAGLKAARRSGGDLRLVAPPSNVVAILDMMNLRSVLIVHDSTEDAFPTST